MGPEGAAFVRGVGGSGNLIKTLFLYIRFFVRYLSVRLGYTFFIHLTLFFFIRYLSVSCSLVSSLGYSPSQSTCWLAAVGAGSGGHGSQWVVLRSSGWCWVSGRRRWVTVDGGEWQYMDVALSVVEYRWVVVAVR